MNDDGKILTNLHVWKLYENVSMMMLVRCSRFEGNQQKLQETIISTAVFIVFIISTSALILFHHKQSKDFWLALMCSSLPQDTNTMLETIALHTAKPHAQTAQKYWHPVNLCDYEYST